MKAIASLLSLMAATLSVACAQEDYVSSTNASYDGNALVLSGHVVLDHGLGQMTAEEASLEKQEAGKDFPFAMIHLSKDVLLSLKSSAKLSCDKADLDFNALRGVLTAPQSGKVSYVDSINKKNGSTSFLRLLSHSIELSLLKNETGEKKTDYDIDTLLAKDDVIIDYNNAFVLRAARALYRKSEAHQSTTSKEFQGTITAYPKDSSSRCILNHEGDVVESDSVDIDLMESRLSMLKPTGVLVSPLFSQTQKSKLEFSGDHLHWDQLLQSLTLKGHPLVKEECLGTLSAEDELTIQQATLKGKRIIKSLSAKGMTELIYLVPPSSDVHKLKCKGLIVVDKEHLNATLISPQKDGLTPIQDQIYYEEPSIGCFADKAFVEYTETGHTVQPVSLSLKGNVSLFSHEKEKPFRCALADRLQYSPSTKTLILSADPGKRVLFWDEEQSLRIAAQEVHIIEDAQTHKSAIKGVGNVKFLFSSEENDKLQKLFPQFQPSSPGTP